MKESYTYDGNGNRLTEVNTLRSINRNEDRLISAGSVSYDFDRDGSITTRTNGSAVTTYNYSTMGELLAVELPNGTDVTYDHDPLGRRISKSVNGVIVERYLWEGRTKLLAIYGIVNNQERVLQRFEYAGGRMPVSMLQWNGSTDVRYYLLYDQVGTLCAVTDSNGATVKHVTYDSFGNILTDSNPSFTIPFGFAGGLHDRDTGLVRFGYRDYDPETGRWTPKDPVGFGGRDTNLYNYAMGAPILFVDPTGLWGESIWGFVVDLVGSMVVPGYLEGRATLAAMEAAYYGTAAAEIAEGAMAEAKYANRYSDIDSYINVLQNRQQNSNQAMVMVGGGLTSATAAAVHGHHVFTRAFKTQFSAIGVKVNDFIIELPINVHYKIHGFAGGKWNAEWKAFFATPGKKNRRILS